MEIVKSKILDARLVESRATQKSPTQEWEVRSWMGDFVRSGMRVTLKRPEQKEPPAKSWMVISSEVDESLSNWFGSENAFGWTPKRV